MDTYNDHAIEDKEKNFLLGMIEVVKPKEINKIKNQQNISN